MARVLTSVGYCLLFIRVLSQSFRSPTIPGRFIVGAYSGSVYLSTLIGGWFADRVLGAERTLFYSGIVIMIGHILLAIVPGLQGLILGLVFVALGSGGVKAPVSAMVGSLYENDKYRSLRDAGFFDFLYCD